MNRWRVSVAMAAVSLVLGGCGALGSSPLVTCTSDPDCGTGYLCHLEAGQCVRACQAAADCPTWAAACAALPGVGGGATSFCQCQSDALCAQELGPGTRCEPGQKTCVYRGEDGGTGSGETDGGGGSGGGGGGCDPASQPDRCGYGHYCDTGACSPVAAPSCPNFQHAPVSWSAASSSGPVIYALTSAQPDASFCPGGSAAFTAVLRAYRKEGAFPPSVAQLQDLFYVQEGGNTIPAGADLIRPTDYHPSSDGKRLQAQLTWCGSTSSTHISVGLYFSGGNPYCAQIAR